MPITNYKTRLMIDEAGDGKYAMLCPIKGSPALGGEPNLIPVTTNEDSQEMNLFGIQKSEATSVKAPFDPVNFNKIKNLTRKTLNLAVWYGNTGEGDYAKASFTGQIDVSLPGTDDVDQVDEMTISITSNSEITMEEGTVAEGDAGTE